MCNDVTTACAVTLGVKDSVAASKQCLPMREDITAGQHYQP